MTNIIGNIITENGYTMILQQNDFNMYQDVETMIGFVKEKRLQGVICLGGNFTEIEEDSFDDIRVPVVLTSVNTISKKGKKNYSSVGIDNSQSAYKAVNYLIGKGHRNIALILGEANDMGVSWWRLGGYKKALEDNSIEVDEELIMSGDYTSSRAYEKVKEILKTRKDITAIFALSDIMALGAMKAVIDSGLRVPEDISIIGFDGMEESKYYNPSITTVKQPKREMAETSINLLFSLMNTDIDNKHIILDTELVERDSCFNI